MNWWPSTSMPYWIYNPSPIAHVVMRNSQQPISAWSGFWGLVLTVKKPVAFHHCNIFVVPSDYYHINGGFKLGKSSIYKWAMASMAMLNSKRVNPANHPVNQPCVIFHPSHSTSRNLGTFPGDAVWDTNSKDCAVQDICVKCCPLVNVYITMENGNF